MSDFLPFLQGLDFTLPWVFLLLPLPWLVYRFWAPASRQHSALLVPFFNDLPLEQTAGQIQPQAKNALLLSAVIWLLLLLSASGPRWIGEPVELPVSGRDTLLAVDLSGSMQIPDMRLHGREANRLEVIKNVVSQFLDKRKGDRVGLVLFGTETYLQAPLTFDLETVRTLLNEATIGIAGEATAIGDAIGMSVRQLRKRPKEQRVMILLTDGANTAGNLSPAQATDLATREQVKIYTVGVGAEEMLQSTFFGTRRVNPSADLDEKLLKEIATRTGGRYFRARSTEELKEVYSAIDALEPIEVSKETFRPVKQLFFWPLGLAAALAALLAVLRLAPGRTVR